MMNYFNQLVLTFVPLIPRIFLRRIAGKYVAGETKEEALATVQSLNNQGFSATIDILGEHVKSAERATEVTQSYAQLFKEIQKRNLDCNVSIKPTHVGMELSERLFAENLSLLLAKAKEHDNFLRIDMENSPYTDLTIAAYQSCLTTYQKVGTVFQAYLHRTEKDLLQLFSPDFNFRLCKGIYREDPNIAIQERSEISNNFLNLLRIAFKNECYVGIATHDLSLLDNIYQLIDEMQVPTSKFEFQVLYGVPMSGWLEKHLEKGYKVRLYVPFGPEWYDYSVRRLKENPNIVGYVMANFFHKK